MDFFEFVISLVTIGGTFITIWVVVLYRRKEKTTRHPGTDADGEYDLQELSEMARSMDERIETLEAILDAEVPGWRQQHEQQQ